MRTFQGKLVLFLMVFWAPMNSMPDPCAPCSCFCSPYHYYSHPCIGCSNRGLTSIPPFQMNFIKTVKTLLMKSNHLTALEREIFKNYSNLTRLDLQDNKISNVSNASLNGLKMLKTLHLNRNRIQLLDCNTFQELERLENLHLSENKIPNISNAVFRGLKSLKELYLDRNRLQKLESNTFQCLESLSYLDLSDNEIYHISKDSFIGLKSLIDLVLHGNRIQTLESSIFQHLENLETLNLYRNEISNICEDSFSGLEKLIELQLGGNRMQMFKSGTFAALKALEILHVNHNNITIIGRKSFVRLENLNKLYLHGNDLKYIPEALWLLRSSDLKLHLNDNPLQCSCNLINEVKQLEFKVKTLRPTVRYYIEHCANVTSVCEDGRNLALGMNVHHTCSAYGLHTGYNNAYRSKNKLTKCPSSTCWKYLQISLPGVMVVTKVILNMTLLELHARRYRIIISVKVGDKTNNTYTLCGAFTLTPGISTVDSSCATTPFGSNVLVEITPNHKHMMSQNYCFTALNDFASVGKRQVAVHGYEMNKYNIWGGWNQWGPCSIPCGYGARKRNRTCTKATAARCLISKINNQRGLVEFQWDSCIIKPCSQAIYSWTIGGITGVFVLVMVGIVFWYRKYKMIVYFEGLRPNPTFQLDQNRTLMEQIEELPYDLHWEFPRYDVRFGSVLGEGNFGRVWLAKAKGIKAFNPRDRSDLSSRAKLAKLQDQRVHNYFTTVTEAWVLGDCDSTHHYEVAVKTLKECATPKHKMDLASELKLLIYMDRHPNIVNVLASCTIRGDLWMIMEYCHHGNLKQFLSDRRNRFNSSWSKESPDISAGLCSYDLLQMSEQITKGVMFLHCWKVVHRDLSARNILIDANFNLKLADFGLARPDNFVAPVDDIMPIKWSSIESLLRHEYTLKSDIWSLGVLLWEIYSLGEMPYPGMNSREVIQQLKQGYRMGPPKHCPHDIWSIISGCWNTAPEKRPTAMELFELLNEIKVAACSAPDGEYYGQEGDYGYAGTVPGPSLDEVLQNQDNLGFDGEVQKTLTKHDKQGGGSSSVTQKQHRELEEEVVRLQVKVQDFKMVKEIVYSKDIQNNDDRVEKLKIVLNNHTKKDLTDNDTLNNLEVVDGLRKVNNTKETEGKDPCEVTYLQTNHSNIILEESSA